MALFKTPAQKREEAENRKNNQQTITEMTLRSEQCIKECLQCCRELPEFLNRFTGAPEMTGANVPDFTVLSEKKWTCFDIERLAVYDALGDFDLYYSTLMSVMRINLLFSSLVLIYRESVDAFAVDSKGTLKKTYDWDELYFYQKEALCDLAQITRAMVIVLKQWNQDSPSVFFRKGTLESLTKRVREVCADLSYRMRCVFNDVNDFEDVDEENE